MRRMDKRLIFAKISRSRLPEALLSVATQSALSAHEAATHGENPRPEDQYDTRGLEASYLAGAQSRRAMELEEALALYRHLDLATFTQKTPISSTALVELDCEGKRSFYLLMPLRGGMTVTFEGKQIQTVTPQSPMGSALLGRRVGDEIQVEIQRVIRDYEVISIS